MRRRDVRHGVLERSGVAKAEGIGNLEKAAGKRHKCTQGVAPVMAQPPTPATTVSCVVAALSCADRLWLPLRRSFCFHFSFLALLDSLFPFSQNLPLAYRCCGRWSVDETGVHWRRESCHLEFSAMVR